MERYDGFPTYLGPYSCNNGGHEMSINDGEFFDFLLRTEISSEFTHLNHQTSDNSSLNTCSPVHHSLYAQSAFTTYIKADPKAAAIHFPPAAQSLHKRCIRFLRKIKESRRKLASEMSDLTAAPVHNNFQDPQAKIGIQNKSAFEHMVAERERRIKLKRHFSDVYALLPRNSKKDKLSILTNAARYLRELKIRVARLEQQNQNLEDLNPTNIFNQNEGGTGFESHKRPFYSDGAILHRRDEVALEKCEDIPSQINLRINVRTDLISCPAALLVKLMELLRVEQLEVLSMESHTEALRFSAHFLLRSKGEEWDTFKWQKFGSVVTECLIVNRDEFVVHRNSTRIA